jgi:hypothetical protein
VLTWLGSHWRLLLIVAVDVVIVAYLWADLFDVREPLFPEFDAWHNERSAFERQLDEIVRLPEVQERIA